MPLPIALDHRPALLSPTGLGRAARELARALAQRDDVDLHLFGHCLARARVACEVPANTTLHRLPIPGRALPLLRRCGLGADVLAGGVRVFHWLDYVFPPVRRARLVLTVHDLAFLRDPGWHGPAAAGLAERTRAAAALAEVIVTPSRATASDVRQLLGDTRPVRVIPFGADHVPTGPTTHPLGGRDYALAIGTIEPRKNHRTLLAAWRRLRSPRPLLVVIGRVGWQCAAIVQELRQAGDEGLVRWLPDCDDAAAFRWLQHARCLVFPSAWEGFGFPPLEAMQLGVPVVASDIAPLRELGADAMQFVAAGDPDALADGITRLLGDTTLHHELARRGRARANTFRWRDCAAAHAALYHEVAS